MQYVIEPQKQAPVIYDVDVAVAGGGVAGVFAAIAAARNGASTILIDRFGSVGGNIGPGMICNGNMISGRAHEKLWYECTVYPRLYGIGKEFIDRYAELGGGSLPPLAATIHRPNDASIAAYVAQTMLEESGVKLLLSTWCGDPIMEDRRVGGLFVENKSGRQAVKARVVIDATGEADVARRAGAPILYPKAEYHELDGHSPTGMGLYFLVGGIDWDRYNRFVEQDRVSDDDLAWGKERLDALWTERFRPFLPLLRRAMENNGYRMEDSVDLEEAAARIGAIRIGPMEAGSLGHGNASPSRIESLDAGNGRHISALEAALRRRISYDVYCFWRRYVPGFENASLLVIAPFLGVRGGPCIEGEYTLTMDDCRTGRRFDDVLYLYGEFRALRWTAERGEVKWVDLPYRVMVPKSIDGLLAVGRSASGQPDTLLRNRMAAKVMGQAGGAAAALCARANVTPRQLNVKSLQLALLDQGYYLGDRHRLKELQLI